MIKIQIGTRVTRTSYTGFVMTGTVVALKKIGTMIYADIKNDFDEHTTQCVPVRGLQVIG